MDLKEMLVRKTEIVFVTSLLLGAPVSVWCWAPLQCLNPLFLWDDGIYREGTLGSLVWLLVVGYQVCLISGESQSCPLSRRVMTGGSQRTVRSSQMVHYMTAKYM